MKVVLLRSLLVLFFLTFLRAPIARAHDGDEVETKGFIETLSESSVTVSLVTYALTSETEFEDENENPTTLDSFSAGDFVEVEGSEEGGILVAREMKHEDDDDDSSDDDSSDDDSSDDNSSDDDSSDDGDDDDDDDSSASGSNSAKTSPVNGMGDKKVRLKAKLAPNTGAGVDTLTHGKAQVRNRSKKGGKELRTRFKVAAKILVPSTVPAVNDGTSAANTRLLARLSRAGTVYAVCELRYGGLRQKAQNRFAEYRVRLRFRQKKDGRIRLRAKGVCDTDPGTAGTQEGIPSVAAGDTVTIVEDTGGGDVTILSGGF